MPIYFADSSALLKRYRKENGPARVLDLLANASRTFISRPAAVEVSSALVRRAKAANLSAHDLAKALAYFDADLQASLDIIELDELVMSEAMNLARRGEARRPERSGRDSTCFGFICAAQLARWRNLTPELR